jgi:3-dehydroquinate synthase
MPAFEVKTARSTYRCVVEKGMLQRASSYLPEQAGKLFVLTTRDVWDLHRGSLDRAITESCTTLFFPGGEQNKRLSCVEALADEMLDSHADRSSIVIGFGGGIVTDIAGFLAAIYMRGIPVLQIPTTLLGQVDAAIGGKTGVNLAAGKNLVGSFHQPAAVLIDPDVLGTLPSREYHAGLYEVIKYGIIRDPHLFDMLERQSDAILARAPEMVEHLIAASVRIKAEVVSADERESDLRRVLNFGHTIGHAIEAATGYERFLHGEAIGWGMLSAIRLAELTGHLQHQIAKRMSDLVRLYGPLPSAEGLDPESLVQRLASDKKTLQGKVHFVLPTAIGQTTVVTGIDPALIREAMAGTLH